MPYFCARFSAVWIMVMPAAESFSASHRKSLNSTGAPSLKPVRCVKAAIGLRVMDSAPTSSATSAQPLSICSPAWRNSSKPVPQMRWVISAGTAWGTPAYRPMWRGSMNCS